MSVRPPRLLAPSRPDEVFNPLREEILQEQASALGHAARKLEAALAALAGAEEGSARHEELLDRAGEAVWSFVVQREACGLRNTETVLRHYGIPPEVRRRMGIRPRRAT